MTVTFEDAATGSTFTQTRQLEATGLDTSAVLFSSTPALAAPTLTIDGIPGPLRRAETTSTTHDVQVSGLNPGDTVELYVMDASGYEKNGGNGTETVPSDPFHANQFDAAPMILTGTADANGIATFTVDLSTGVAGAAPATVDDLFFFSAGVVDTSGNLISALSEPTELKVVATSTNPPAITSDDTFNYIETGTGPVFTATASDVELDPITFDLGGADAALFDIDPDTGVVTFATLPTFNIPDGDGDGYEDIEFIDDVVQALSVTLIASDGTGQTTQDVTVNFLKDTDADTIADLADNAIFVANTDQADTNLDGRGDVLAPDLNGDGVVSLLDFSILSAAFNTSAGDADYDARADINYDDTVSLLDFSELSAVFNTPLPQLSSVDLIDL